MQPRHFLRLRAAIERRLVPYQSTCGRCRRPWKFVMHHDTQYTESRACFPLCEGCWRELGMPGRRLPYYERMWAKWTHPRDHSEWEQIKRAVLEGK